MDMAFINGTPSPRIRPTFRSQDSRPTFYDPMPSAVPFTLTTGADVRYLTLSPHDTITIGRASKSEGKCLQACIDNALFDCPVVSRSHAEIRIHPFKSFDEQITIMDHKSMHGTSVNGERLPAFVPKTLRSGDVIKLGDRVVRGSDHHDGVKVTFHRPAPPFAANANTYTVPNDESGSDVESTFSEQEHYSSAQTTPESAKTAGDLGSSQQPIDLEAPVVPVIQDTYADDEINDDNEDDDDGGDDDDDESDVPSSDFDELTREILNEESEDEAEVEGEDPMEEAPEEYPVRPGQSYSPELGSLEASVNVPGQSMWPPPPPSEPAVQDFHSYLHSKPPVYPTHRDQDYGHGCHFPAFYKEEYSHAPAPLPKSRISISDIVENISVNETPAKKADRTLSSTGTKRKASDVESSAHASAMPEVGTSEASENTVSTYEPVASYAPPAKRAKKMPKKPSMSAEAGKFAAAFLAGSAATVAFLISPLAQRMLEAM